MDNIRPIDTNLIAQPTTLEATNVRGSCQCGAIFKWFPKEGGGYASVATITRVRAAFDSHVSDAVRKAKKLNDPPTPAGVERRRHVLTCERIPEAQLLRERRDEKASWIKRSEERLAEAPREMADRLRKIARALDDCANDVIREVAALEEHGAADSWGGQTGIENAIRQTQHAVLWMVPNLHLDDLVQHAAEYRSKIAHLAADKAELAALDAQMGGDA